MSWETLTDRILLLQSCQSGQECHRESTLLVSDEPVERKSRYIDPSRGFNSSGSANSGRKPWSVRFRLWNLAGIQFTHGRFSRISIMGRSVPSMHKTARYILQLVAQSQLCCWHLGAFVDKNAVTVGKPIMTYEACITLLYLSVCNIIFVEKKNESSLVSSKVQIPFEPDPGPSPASI